MFIRIYDSRMNILGEIDNITSLIYERGFFSSGQFEMHLPYSKAVLNLLDEENFLFIDNRRDKGMICEDFETSDGQIKIKGINLGGIFGRRVVLPPAGENYLRFEQMPAEDIMTALVESQCIRPESGYRKMSLLNLGVSQKRGGIMNLRTGFEQMLSEVLYETGISSGLGFNVFGDFENKSLLFSVTEGMDLSAIQKENPPVIFSKGYDNLSSALYREEGGNEKNAVYGVSGDISLNEHLLYVSKSERARGMNLKEVCLKSAGETALEISFDTQKRLMEGVKKKIVRAGIENSASFTYEKDWNLGDMVTVVHQKAQRMMHERVTKVTEIYEQGQMRLEAVFGTEENGFRQRIETIERKVRF